MQIDPWGFGPIGINLNALETRTKMNANTAPLSDVEKAQKKLDSVLKVIAGFRSRGLIPTRPYEEKLTAARAALRAAKKTAKSKSK